MTSVYEVRGLCERRGIKVEPFGQGFRLRGAGCDILVADLTAVTPADLLPTPDARQHALKAIRESYPRHWM
ncbi:MAG: hypothetical protein KJZ96_12180 [Rhodocyclaceae bacterium]|nr:hypothetical protein [Rhodocyclaceae bacterium]